MTALQVCRFYAASLLLALAVVALCVPALAETASWYGPGFHGRLTASGERFNQNALTCASRRHNFGVWLRVTNLKNGKTAVCRVNDFGPALWTGRKLDVSKGMARALGMLISGVVKVRIEIVK